MATEIRAHKVLDLLREAPMSKQALEERTVLTFGEDAIFCTCKIKGFDLEALLNFFIEEQKVIEDAGIWTLNEGELCSH
jgi:probable metal-binding protein